MSGSALGGVGAAGLFLLFQLCGVCVADRVLDRESGGVRLLLGSVCGSVMFQWFPIPFAFFLGFTPAAHLPAAALAMAAAFLCLRKENERGKRLLRLAPEAISSFRRRKFLLLPGIMCLFFAFLVLHSFRWVDGKIFSSQATFGDMCMQLSFITSLAKQGRFPPDYSLLPGTRLSYPFLSDSVSSSLYLMGAPLRFAYCFPMFFAGAQVFFGMYLFAARLLKNRRKAAFAWIFFFFNGGLGFRYFLSGEKTLDELMNGFYQTPTNLAEKGLRWVNVVVDMMLPQRATLFGWAVLFPILYLLYRAVYEGEKRYFLYAGILGGLLPMIHTHSFLALALVCGAWLVFSLVRKLSLGRQAVRFGKVFCLAGLPAMGFLQAVLQKTEKTDAPGLLFAALGVLFLCVCLTGFLVWKTVCREGWRELAGTWGVLLLAVCVLALPQLFTWTFRQAGDGSFVRGHFGWVIGESNYFLFYLENIGLSALLALAGLLLAGDMEFMKYSPAVVIWFVAEFIEFQPNDYDNNKLLYVAFALLCCAAGDVLDKLLEKLKQRGIRTALAAVCFAVCTLSAGMTMLRETVARYELFGEGALELCRYLEENTEPDAIVLTDTRHNNEIASLTGRNIVCGSPSYLFFHGLPYGQHEWAAQQMYDSPEDTEDLFRRIGVDYVLISDFEMSSYGPDPEKFDKLFPRVYDDGVRVLYKTGYE